MATKTKTTSAIDRERELDAALAEAKADLDTIRTRRAKHDQRIRDLSVELDGRPADHRDEFGETGQPLKGTEAGKLREQIDKLVAEDNFAPIIRAAEYRVSEAESALIRHRRDNARDLMLDLLPEAQAATDRCYEWVGHGPSRRPRLLRLRNAEGRPEVL